VVSERLRPVSLARYRAWSGLVNYLLFQFLFSSDQAESGLKKVQAGARGQAFKN